MGSVPVLLSPAAGSVSHAAWASSPALAPLLPPTTAVSYILVDFMSVKQADHSYGNDSGMAQKAMPTHSTAAKNDEAIPSQRGGHRHFKLQSEQYGVQTGRRTSLHTSQPACSRLEKGDHPPHSTQCRCRCRLRAYRTLTVISLDGPPDRRGSGANSAGPTLQSRCIL